MRRRWDAFWCAVVIGLAALDAWREREDIRAGRTHSDGTTFSSFNRRIVEWLRKHVPGGRFLFPLGLDVLRDWYVAHIDAHLDNQRARW